MNLWHRMFHRNPRRYPLPYGFGCRGCDRQRALSMMDYADRGVAEAAAMSQAFKEHTAWLRTIGR